MKHPWVVVALVLALGAPVRAEQLRWYRGFYARVGLRDTYGVQEPFHAWAAFAFGIGYRFDRDIWGVDISALNFQYDPEEGLHSVARVVPYVGLRRWTRTDTWIGAGLSYGWIKGTVDEAIAKRRGEGWQAEAIAGIELPRALRVRLFSQFTFTWPLYDLHDLYDSRDSLMNVFSLEAALGLRF